MALVAYPYHVIHNGIEYAPNAAIEVDDPDNHIGMGAVLIAPTSTDDPEPVAKKTRKRKTGGE